eukprot:gi/632957754/ref/XP_007894658.1/ PREDICTED: integrin alpha-E-like [Callorhinchus milii]
MEIAIILDGSGSIDAPDFQRAKTFIINIITNIWKVCFECDFALVQYGTKIETIFDLNESRTNSSGIFSIVKNMRQLGNVTKTASAIQHALDHIFNEEKGSKANAKKFIVVVTDGEIYRDPLDISDVVNSLKMNNVERFAIGVGDATKKPKPVEELKLIASDPDDKHLFSVDNYAALDGLLENLEKNIVGIEGTQGAFEMQLAQAGFSAQYTQDGNILIGAVGAYDWAGGVIMYNETSQKVQFLNESKPSEDTTYGYLGYSVTTVKGASGDMYIAGAPRYNQTGQVLVFEAGASNTIKHRLKGKQLGSYFGSELCALDLNRDGATDYLLVGAPFYHKQGEEGIVYVYHLNEKNYFEEKGNLSGLLRFTRARFGFAIANIGDINKDGYNDIAIGAPLEEDGTGSIYIFNGNKDNGLETHSQRIPGKEVKTGLQYFGQSIGGATDVDEDGLIDITVGSCGAVVVLSSRPVINVIVTVTFSPESIPLPSTTHQRQEQLIHATVCFTTGSNFKSIDLSNTNANYTIILDTKQKIKRVKFTNNVNPYTLSSFVTLSSDVCESYNLTIQRCTTDCVSDVDVEVNFTLDNTEKKNELPLPVLDKFKDVSVHFQLPFQKDCGPDNICLAKLNLMSTLSPANWIVGSTANVTMDMRLSNKAASYFTTMDISHPDNLDFKFVRSETVDVQCNTEPATISSLSLLRCLIAHPILKSKSSITVSIFWSLRQTEFKGKKAFININVTNKNEAKEAAVQQTHEIFVKHSVNVALSPRQQNKVILINNDWSNQDVHLQFLVTMGNRYNAEVNVTISIPVKIKGLYILEPKMAENSSLNCYKSNSIANPIPKEEFKNQWGCDVKGCECQHFSCPFIPSSGEITVKARLSWANIQQLVKHHAQIVAFGVITFDEDLYQATSSDLHNATVSVSIVKVLMFNTIPVVIGGLVVGLFLLIVLVFILYKCGFFKRNYKYKIELEEETEK